MGIAKTKRMTEATLTCHTKGPGTYPYMAPEMFTKSRRGPAVDIYSLGCLFIELFGRQRVWRQLDGPGIMQKILGTYNNPPQGPSTAHLCPTFAIICSQMCALEANSRPGSREVLASLEKMASDSDSIQRAFEEGFDCNDY